MAVREMLIKTTTRYHFTPGRTARIRNSDENKSRGTSLVVQGLRIFLPTQGTWVPSLVREPRSHTTPSN